MSLVLSLTCDCCEREFESKHGYAEPGRMSPAKLVREAKDEGWKCLGCHNWFCNRCIARAKLMESQPTETAS